mmetsp:Transcript_55684/g.62229  ORF Transcript_55684/g.62229 Transcript_55684/m.62229 type:complete len:120 (-) Transcript_55684:260-619(-)
MKRHTNMSTNENNPLIMIHPEERKRTHTVWQFQIKQEKVSYAYDECLLIIFLIISTKQLLIIVMYNLALTLQLHALSSSSRAVSSSSHNKKTNIELEEDIDPLFTLALTNNLGLIYRTI